MNLKKIEDYCQRLKRKNCVSIAPTDIRTSQQIAAIVVPEFLAIMDNLTLMNYWNPDQCLRLSGIETHKFKCNCTLCILLAQVNYLTR